MLTSHLLECGEVSGWIAPSASAKGSGDAPLLEAVAEGAPSFSADPAEVACGGRMQPRGDGGDHAHFPAQYSQVARSGRRARAGLNENLAREVLELHTLSPAGGYTQGDVQELAKILTGWSVAATEPPFTFVWRPMSHEPGEKRLLGRHFPEGPDSQEAALRMLGTHPATWRHLALKLACHFVADEPPASAVRALEDTLRSTEGDLGAVSKALVHLPEAWANPLGKFRTPMEFVLAAGRAVGLGRPELVIGGLTALGQPLWSAPQPNGWSDTAGDWMGPEGLMRRVDWTYTFTGGLGQVDLAAVTEAALGPLAHADTVGAMRRAGSVRDALTLLLTSMEFQHR